MLHIIQRKMGGVLVNPSVGESGLQPSLANQFTPEDVAAILRERKWLGAAEPEKEREPALQKWLSRAAELLGPHADDRRELATLLEPIFVYDAAATLREVTNQDVLTRTGAREVIRELANHLLDGADVDSDRFRDIVESMKLAVPYRSRLMFLPIRIALTGRAGEGELDRVILLIDSAAKLNFAAAVKTMRRRMLEFCGALD